jgi:CheY-specific phosphatase CheX
MTPEALVTTAGAWLEPEIAQLSGYIWQSTLGLEIYPIPVFPPELAALPTMDGFINITGDWQGALALQVPVPLAERVASIMFSLDRRRPTAEDVLDALGEITNQTGGNVKSLMPGVCHLSLPAVVRGSDYTIHLRGTEVVTRVVLACEDSAFIVNLLAAR